MALSVREASPRHIPGLVPLLEELGYPVATGLLEDRFRFFSSKGERALVAEQKGEIIGLLTLLANPGRSC